MGWKPYQQGRRDYRDEKVIPPRDYGTTERQQWEQGWADQCKDEIHPDAPPIDQDEKE